MPDKFTNIDESIKVADEKVAQNSGFIEVTQMNHILDTIPRRRVHRPQLGTSSDPAFLSFTNHHQSLYSLRHVTQTATLMLKTEPVRLHSKSVSYC